ncbi:hypothetical protein H4F05_07980 [Vibrio cholerae]
MKKRYTEAQIIKAIKRYEAGAKVDDICPEPFISASQKMVPFCDLGSGKLIEG